MSKAAKRQVKAPDRRKAGRPTALTARVREVIISSLEKGSTFAIACKRAGIGTSTFYRWMERGEAGEPPFREFRDAVIRTEAEAAEALLDSVRLADDWKAQAWLLERRFPADFGRRGPMEAPPAPVVPGAAQAVDSGPDGVRKVLERLVTRASA